MMNKYTNILEGQKNIDSIIKCRKLFEELYDNFLLMYNTNLSGIPGDYELYFKIMASITSDNFDDFFSFFSFLKDSNVTFRLNGSNFYITINRIDDFIEMMESKINSKKYNL